MTTATISVTPDLSTLPPVDLIDSEPIRAAIEAYREAQTRTRDAVNALAELQHTGRQQAEQADARALADATTEGRKDPGPKHVQAYERALSEAKRHADAAGLIEHDRRIDLDRAFREHGGELYATIQADDNAVSAEYLDLIAKAERLAQRLTTNRALRGYLDGRRFKGTAAAHVYDGERQRTAGELFELLRDVNGDRPRGPMFRPL